MIVDLGLTLILVANTVTFLNKTR